MSAVVHAHKAPSILPFAAALSGIVFLYFPSLLYTGNLDDFVASFAYLAVVLLTGFCFFTALLCVPQFFLRGNAKSAYGSLLASFAILGWVSGTFLFGHRGVLDGEHPLQSASIPYQIVEMITLWISLGLLLLLFFRKRAFAAHSAFFLLIIAVGSFILTF